MFANKFFLLFINFLWMAGLFGALFALLYLAQYRRRHWWSTGVYQVPRTLAPLYGALVLFLSGLALHAYAVGQPATLVVAAIWALLALFFLYHAIELVIDGVQEGWDSALVEPQVGSTMGSGFSVGAIVVTLLLMVNVGMLSWWGAGQVRAGTLDLQALTKPFANRAVAPSGEVRPPAAATPGNQPATGLGAWMTNVTTVVGEQITAISQGFLTTPATPPATPTLTRVLTPFAGGQAALDAQRAITPTATLTATLSATATVTATVTPTVTATVTPTVTPTATPTVTPTVTPPPTSSPPPRPTATATVTATPRPSPTPTVVAGVVTPLNPLTGESSNGVVRFEWSANFTPSEGYAFELVFWRPQQEPLKQGFGVAAPTRGYEAKVDLRELDNRLGDRLEPGTYQWGLLLVRTQPTYTRIRYVGGDWLVTYNR